MKSLRPLLLLYLVLLYTSAEATHIVGGVMNYRYIGDDKYEITLYVYRDYKRAQPGAYFDFPYARIRVWDGSSETVYGFSLNRVDTLNDVLVDPCATIIPDEGVDWTKYLDTLTLPAIEGDYIIYYQRCCRNNSIDNLTRDPISNEIEWGATYTITIPGSPEPIQNSSPVITNYPPVYICANKQLKYDHSAIDADGDSLVYSLCSPFTGASIYDPVNDYTNEFPPFDTVIWKSPYSLANLLGGNPLSVHPETGMLTGTPNTVGQFVVGICIEEYRNGVRMTKTIRDFQFNVVDCGLQVISSFFAPSILCNDFTVNFDNQSIGATSYKWHFGDGDSSLLQFPTHTYRDTGIYNVTLVCNEGADCSATYSKEISIQYKRIDADFNISDSTCLAAGDTIQFYDQSTDSFNVTSWQWSLPDNQVSAESNPYILYDGSSTAISATLMVTSVNGCTSTASKTFPVFSKPELTLSDTISECAGTRIQIPLITEGNNLFEWTPVTGLDNPNLQQPTATVAYPVTYHVTVKSVLSNGDTCIQQDSIFIDITEPEVSIRPDNTIFCGDSVQATANASGYTSLLWAADRNFSTILSSGTSLNTYQTETEQWYFVKATFKTCFDMDSILLKNSSIGYSVENNSVCEGENIRTNLTVQTSSPYNIIWSINNDTIETTNNSSLDILPDASQTVYVTIRNSDGCEEADSFQITVLTLPVVDASVDKAVIYKGEQVQLDATVNQQYTYQWLPSDLVSNATIVNPISSPVQSTIYTVIVTDENQCTNRDTVRVQVLDYACNGKFIFIPNAFSPNNDGINDELWVRSTILKSMHLEIYDRWGHKVFETDDLNTAWNGHYKDQASPQDTYGYYFTGECLQNEKITLKGNITLLR